MKLFRMFGRSIRDSFKSVFRNFSLSLASISCITITLIIVAVSLLASFNVNNFEKSIEKDVTVVVFLNNDITKEEEQEFETKLKGIDNIASFDFRSKEQAKEEMQKESEVFNNVMSTWSESENPLKDSYLIKVKEIDNIKKTAESLKSMNKVALVNYGESFITTMTAAFKTIQKVSIIAVAALILVSIFLIVNTIKLTIFSRKREISIMRLVGASNISIKTPFVIEGLILGALGSIIPIGLVCYGYTLLYTRFGGVLYSSLIVLVKPEPFIYYVSLLVLVIGMIVGMIGSAKAVRKYLKV